MQAGSSFPAQEGISIWPYWATRATQTGAGIFVGVEFVWVFVCATVRLQAVDLGLVTPPQSHRSYL